MDLTEHPMKENIRKIEDVIDIQKANGNFSTRQVAFSLPEADSNGERAAAGAGAGAGAGADLARSFETVLASAGAGAGLAKKKLKNQRFKRYKSPSPDVVSWPSDSDITVLRMKLCLREGAPAASVGDGLHQPDSSSMINLATLVMQSPSKCSVNIEEYLLPLTSWERPARAPEAAAAPRAERPDTGGGGGSQQARARAQAARDAQLYEAMCSHHHHAYDLSSKDSGLFSRIGTKSKLAKFLRLYFCPCCTCLYEMEKMPAEPSACLTSRYTLEPEVISN